MDRAADKLARLATEQVNPASEGLDTLDTLAALRVMNAEDHKVADAVEGALPAIAGLVNAVAERLADGGRLVYVGAGTSGRLGVLDASECPPTFGVPEGMVQGVIAGGEAALTHALEGIEDDAAQGAADMAALRVGEGDAVVGLAASGRTPYVVGALDFARSVGAVTGSVSCVRDAELSRHVDHAIECETGPEVVMGSTRLKAGTAEKMVLNMISTEAMVRMGKVYGNLMVDLVPKNEKLRARARRIVALAAGCDEKVAADALDACQGDTKAAICVVAAGVSPDQARGALDSCGGSTSLALEELRGQE